MVVLKKGLHCTFLIQTEPTSHIFIWTDLTYHLVQNRITSYQNHFCLNRTYLYHFYLNRIHLLGNRSLTFWSKQNLPVTIIHPDRTYCLPSCSGQNPHLTILIWTKPTSYHLHLNRNLLFTIFVWTKPTSCCFDLGLNRSHLLPNCCPQFCAYI